MSDAEGSAEGFPGAEKSVDWEEVRRVYELSGERVGAIRERFGLTEYQFRRRRTLGGWTARPQVAEPGALQGCKPVGAEALDFRLNRLVAIGTSMLERKVADEGMTEANARTLKELCRAQETRMRSTRNEKAAKAREKKSTDDGHDFRDDPAWLRAEINRRLDRLFDPGAMGGASRNSTADGGTQPPGDLAPPLQHGPA